MTPPMCLIRRLLKDEKGATAVEYAIMVSLIAVAIIGAVTILGNDLNVMLTNVPDTISE